MCIREQKCHPSENWWEKKYFIVADSYMLEVFLKNEMLSPDLCIHSMRDVTFEKNQTR